VLNLHRDFGDCRAGQRQDLRLPGQAGLIASEIQDGLIGWLIAIGGRDCDFEFAGR